MSTTIKLQFHNAGDGEATGFRHVALTTPEPLEVGKLGQLSGELAYAIKPYNNQEGLTRLSCDVRPAPADPVVARVEALDRAIVAYAVAHKKEWFPPKTTAAQIEQTYLPLYRTSNPKYPKAIRSKVVVNTGAGTRFFEADPDTKSLATAEYGAVPPKAAVVTVGKVTGVWLSPKQWGATAVTDVLAFTKGSGGAADTPTVTTAEILDGSAWARLAIETPSGLTNGGCGGFVNYAGGNFVFEVGSEEAPLLAAFGISNYDKDPDKPRQNLDVNLSPELAAVFAAIDDEVLKRGTANPKWFKNKTKDAIAATYRPLLSDDGRYAPRAALKINVSGSQAAEITTAAGEKISHLDVVRDTALKATVQLQMLWIGAGQWGVTANVRKVEAFPSGAATANPFDGWTIAEKAEPKTEFPGWTKRPRDGEGEQSVLLGGGPPAKKPKNDHVSVNLMQ